ncbi:MAG: heme-binding domain-containing protein [Candidatus Methylomirabilales bacterium]
MSSRRSRRARRVLIGVVMFVLGIQAIPYGHNHTDPPVRTEPTWDSRQTQELAARACYDCHSNKTVWPWYANIAPVSWLTQRDVNDGRKVLNFSEGDRSQKGAQKLVRAVRKGEMPPWYYAAFNPQGTLSSAEHQALIRGLEATSPGQQ